MKCRVFSCRLKARCRELCKKHYQRLLYHTNPVFKSRVIAYNRLWYSLHKERAKNYMNEWRKNNRAKAIHYKVKSLMEKGELYRIPKGKIPEISKNFRKLERRMKTMRKLGINVIVIED